MGQWCTTVGHTVDGELVTMGQWCTTVGHTSVGEGLPCVSGDQQ